jgi:hypothetical protein
MLGAAGSLSGVTSAMGESLRINGVRDRSAGALNFRLLPNWRIVQQWAQLSEKTEDPLIKQELLELAAVCDEVANSIEDRLTGG